MSYSCGMDETERAFIERLKSTHGAEPFAPGPAIEEFRLSELPGAVRAALVVHGPGIGATKALTRWLQEAGAIRDGHRRGTGYLWRLP